MTDTLKPNTTTVSVEAMTRVMQEIDLLPKPDQWTLIDPQGRFYTGKVEDVMRVLIAPTGSTKGLTP